MSGSLRQVWALLQVPRGRLLLGVALGALSLGAGTGLTATAAWLLARAAQQPPVLALSVAVVAVRAFGLGRPLARYAERLVTHDLALRSVGALRVHLYERLAAAPSARVVALRRGELLAHAGAGLDGLADLVARVAVPGLSALVGTVVGLAVVGVVLPAAGVAAAGVVAVTAVGAALLAAHSARSGTGAAAEVRHQIAQEVHDRLTAADELRVAGLVPARAHRLAVLEARLDRAGGRVDRAGAAATAVVLLGQGAAVLVVLAMSLRASAGGSLAPVLVPVAVLTALATTEHLLAIPSVVLAAVRVDAAAGPLLELLDAAGRPVPSAGPGSGTVAGTGGPGLTTRGLLVGHPEGPGTTAVPDLTISPGDRVVLHGPSGSGKSTALLTLAGLLPRRGGEVLLDGRAPDRWPSAALPGRVLFTGEDAHLFATTVGEQLRLGCGPVPDAQVLAVLDRVGLGAWVRSLPEGLETVMGPGGTVVSGGERRRLLVARALLTDAPLLLLDEPTEHLDADAAQALWADLLALPTDVALVVATHADLTGPGVVRVDLDPVPTAVAGSGTAPAGT